MRPDLQPVGPAPHLDHFAHRVGQCRDIAQSLRHRLHPTRVERDAVEHGARRRRLVFAEFEIFLFSSIKNALRASSFSAISNNARFFSAEDTARQLARGDLGLLAQPQRFFV